MKHLLSIFLFLAFIITLNGQPWINNLPQGKMQNGDLTFYEIQKAFNDYWEPYNVDKGYYVLNGEKVKAPYWKQYKRWEWYWENRINPATGEFPKTSAWEELQKFQLANPGSKSTSGNWTAMGPSTTSGGYAGLGRLNCVAFHPTNANTYFVGAASGGIWKTTNGGSSWLPLGDANPVLGVSDIVISTVDPDVIYIATGDRDGGSMWSLGGGQYNDNNSVGILKSTDGGATWNTTGLTFTASQQRTVNRLLMDPGDEDIIYAATSDGFYKTTNAGISWTKTYGTNFVDIKFKPGTSSTIYASNWSGDIYRSETSGSTLSFSQVFTSGNGRVELAVTEDNSNVVYAVMESGGGLGGVYKSTNGGTSFSQIYMGSLNFLGWNCNGGDSGGQGSYDLCIAADPNNANNVFIGGVNTWRSTDGGVNWAATTHWSGCSGITTVHADQHFLKYQHSTSNLFLCNDGGFYKTVNNGGSWTHHGNGLVTSQIYRMGTAQTTSNDVILGLQDNGTKALLSGTWSDELGGDGFECAIDWSNQNIMYGEIYYGDIYRSTNHGVSWSSISSGITGTAWWCAPFVQDANTSNTLYMGYQDVFKSTNQGTSWTAISSWGGGTIRSMAVTPASSNTICAAKETILYRTTNGGSSWSNITGTLPVGSTKITYVWISDTDINTIWVSLGGYNSNGVYQTTNGGANWTNISTGLPPIPVMCVVQNKLNTSQNELYAGTDVGVYVKVGSANWTPFYTGLPNVVVTELDIYYGNGVPANSRLRAATYGRGLWESDLYEAGNLPPVADFSASNTSPLINETVIFTDLSTNGPTLWTWEITGPGNATYIGGTSQNSQNPQVQFDAVGSYTVKLTATNGYGSDIETKTNYITVTSCSYCTSNGNMDYLTSTTLVNFNTINNATAKPAAYNDYTSQSTDVVPGNSYDLTVNVNTDGSYTVLTYVWIDWNQNCDFTDSGEVYNLGSATNVANGATSLSPLSITVPAGAALGSTRMRVSTRYNSAPTSCLTDYDGEVEDYTVNVLGGSPPVADFEADNVAPGIGETVNFTDLSTNTPTSWAWTFTPPTVTYVGGTTASSQNPEVQFDAAGDYTVELVAMNSSGSDTETKVDYIFVIDVPATDFEADNLAPGIGENVTFTDLSTNSPISWAWTFTPSTVAYMGGTTASSQNPEVLFYAAGDYTVELTATNISGSDTETKVDYIFVIDVPAADFEADNLAPGIGETVNFTDLSTNNPIDWVWIFTPSTVSYVGGTTASSQNPEVQFDAAGDYTVELTATNISGSDTETKIDYIFVIDVPAADFEADNLAPGIGETVNFTDLSTNNPIDWAWTFTPSTITYVGGTMASSQNPEVQFDVTGDYTVELTATNISGNDTETKVDYIFVIDVPVADFEADIVTPDIGETVTFTDLSTNTPTSWSWVFTPSTVTYTGGTSSTDANPQVQFDVAGDYTVELTATNISGSDTEIKTDYINALIPIFDLDIKAFLEGPFNGSLMNSDISSVLPLGQPYNVTPWNYNGTETVGSIPTNVVDWVLIEIRDAASAATATSTTEVAKQAAFILNDGSIVNLDGSSNLQFEVAISQNMFVVVWQRNHLGIISNDPLIPSGNLYTYDFSTGINQVFGGIDGHKQISIGVWGMVGGDGNHDGLININDKSPVWEDQAGNKGYLFEDHNLDGEVNNQDKDDIWVPNETKSSQVPN